MTQMPRVENLHKMDQFFQRHKLQKLTQGNLGSPISTKEIESTITNLKK